MPPEELEANYLGLVACGATTWAALRATATAEGWPVVIALCDKHDTPRAAIKPPARAATRNPKPA